MNKSKLKKYVGKEVKVYFRHRLKPRSGIVQYRPNEPLDDYYLYQYQYSSGGTRFYIALNHRMIGHIKVIGENTWVNAYTI